MELVDRRPDYLAMVKDRQCHIKRSSVQARQRGIVIRNMCNVSHIESRLNSSISDGLGKCLKLRIFRAGRNNLSGILPTDFSNATKLEQISLPQNSLSGDISERIVNLDSLRILDLNSNGFSGMLPISIELNLGYNNLDGNFSVLDFSKLSQLTKLDLGGNSLSGIIPRSLYSCKSLKAIRMSQNNLEGEIHPDILLLKSLSFLSLGHNRLTNLTGAMKILMYCKSLVFLAFPGSFVGEEMPDNLGMVDFYGFQNLRFLSLAECELTGHIPAYLSKFEKLELLYLGNNRITGSIPSWLGNHRVNSSCLQIGNLTGSIPVRDS
ncbi:hypothetical protein ACLB2K_021626 [Fragaria x ananassa]